MINIIMEQRNHPLSDPAAWDLVAEGYARFSADGMAQYSEEALALAELRPADHVLDVASGPGTLSLLAARRVARVTAIDFSEKMLGHLRTKLKKSGIKNVEVLACDGQALPFKDHSFDGTFSMFGLIFFPDRVKGFGELHRILKPGRKAVVSSWAPLDRSPLMQAIFGAIRAMNKDKPEPPKSPSATEDPRVLQTEMEQGGFKGVRAVKVTKAFPFESVEQFWKAMTAGSIPIALARQEMGEAAWAEKEKLAIDHLHAVWPHFSHPLTSDAWLAIGKKN